MRRNIRSNRSQGEKEAERKRGLDDERGNGREQ